MWGVMLSRKKNEWTSVALMGGFALVKTKSNKRFLVNEAESSSGIEATQAEENYQTSSSKMARGLLAKSKKVEANFALKTGFEPVINLLKNNK